MTERETMARVLSDQEATTPDDGGDPIEASGLSTLSVGCDLGDVAVALERLRTFGNGTDHLARRIVRNRAVHELKRAKVLDAANLVDAALGGARAEEAAAGAVAAFPDVEAWPDPVAGDPLLEDVRSFICRFNILPPGADVVLTMFAVSTHAIAGDRPATFRSTPYLAFESPTPECGKTRALEVLALLVRRPWLTLMPSTAVLFRVLEAYRPTILLDECQAVRGRGEQSEDVRDILLSGYKLGATVPRCVGDDNQVRMFDVFGPKVFALIGELPGPLASRCIRIPMQRRKREEPVERLLPAVEPDGLALARRAARWTADSRNALQSAEPKVPEFITDRLGEIWGPLFVVAAVAGGEWPDRLRAAAQALCGRRDEEDIRTLLLTDIRDVFAERAADRLASAELALALGAIEGRPWADWGKQGKGLTANALARLLKDLRIRPRKMKVHGESVNGYSRMSFVDVWDRYLSAFQPPQPEPSSNDGGKSGFTTGTPCPPGSSCKPCENPGATKEVPVVPVEMQVGPGLDTDIPLPEDPDEVARAAMRDGA